MVWPCKQNASGKTSNQALLARANGKKKTKQLTTAADGSKLLQMNQYYIEDLGWNCLGLHPSEMMGMMENREVW